MTIGYELKKILIKKKGFIILMVGFILVILMQCVQGDGEYLNFDMESDKQQFNAYMQVLSGKMTPDKEEYIIREREVINNAKEIVPKYIQQYEHGEITEIELIELTNNCNKILDKETAFSAVESVYYSALENEKVYFMYTNGWSSLLNREQVALPFVLYLLLILTPVICGEYACEMNMVLHTTKKGRRKLAGSKMIASIVVAAISGVLFKAEQIVFYGIKYGLKEFNYPIQSIPNFTDSLYDMSILKTIILMSLMFILGAIYLSLIIIFLSLILKKALPVISSILTFLVLVPLLLEKKILYYLPTPIGLFYGKGYLGVNCGSEEEPYYISKKLAALIILVSITIMSIIVLYFINIHKIKKARFFSLLVCVILLSGCSHQTSENHDDLLFNGSDSQYLYDNSTMIFNVYDKNPTMIDKKTNVEKWLIRDCFERDEIVKNLKVFADENSVYYLQSINTENSHVLKIIRIYLKNFEEEIIFQKSLQVDTHKQFMGLGTYFLKNDFDIKSIKSFFVVDEKIYISYNSDGIWCYDMNKKSETRIISDSTYNDNISYYNDVIYYTDNLYHINSYNIKTHKQERLTDNMATTSFITEDYLFYINISDKGNLYRIDLETHDEIMILEGNHITSLPHYCTTDGNYIYYINCDDNQSIYRCDLNGQTHEKIRSDECNSIWVFKNYEQVFTLIYDDGEMVLSAGK